MGHTPMEGSPSMSRSGSMNSATSSSGGSSQCSNRTRRRAANMMPLATGMDWEYYKVVKSRRAWSCVVCMTRNQGCAERCRGCNFSAILSQVESPTVMPSTSSSSHSAMSQSSSPARASRAHAHGASGEASSSGTQQSQRSTSSGGNSSGRKSPTSSSTMSNNHYAQQPQHQRRKIPTRTSQDSLWAERRPLPVWGGRLTEICTEIAPAR